jgi:Ca2+/H+ antiporter
MNTIITPVKKIETTTLLSTLWVVVMINMLKADILSLYIPGAAEEVAQTAGDTPIPLLMLGAAVMMEISILMILLSRVLNYRVNRWANIIASLITIAFIVVGRSSLPHYTFIAAVEIVCLILIVWFAWRWRDPEANFADAPAVKLVKTS